ncbi:hypothetical protein K3152_10390 [Qipengyuania sp. 1NDH17]|uniref:asparagine synthase (glutamine-hydrolyzing) n=1 Tax=Qipengyuania polymorpha TaxID=2867234 RepID=A0ABS7IZ15_9SPHN|nr:hypothetical protein [Qipengyuania polymorpha]MBX7458653.1 hypothetical protein [Qipengyuania polymorpha]
MIAAWHGRARGVCPPVDAMLRSLALYGERRATPIEAGPFAAMASDRDYLASVGDIHVALTGWLDNAAGLARKLGLASDDPARIYAASLERWGEDADRHMVGSYAAIAQLADGTLHLARSPWDAPPLYYHSDARRTVASPLLRVLFAAGAPREPDWERVVDELAYDWRSGDERAWHEDIWMVPLGAAVRIDGGERRVLRWYEPPPPMPAEEYDEQAAVSRALELLDEAAVAALRWADKPALAMSGGLDSTLVADALLGALPEPQRLQAITFVPDHRWQGKEEPGTMGDERRFAKLMAKANPRLDWHLASADVGPPDRRAREVFAASEVFAPGLANVGMYHNVYEAARGLGCDSLLTADFGNSTISESGRSAYVEYARSGEWRQLVRLLRNRPGDARPLWRKLLANTVLPQLPRALRSLARRLVHPERADMTALITALSPAARREQAERAAARGTASAWADLTHDRSRADTVQREWRDADGPGRDVDLAFEQLYGIRKRDVLMYRPLVEFCMSLPTRAFAWDGEERRFARLMGRGRVPEAIRTNRLHGQHNVDWHARMTPEREAMREVLETARGHPFLGQALDIDRLQALIDDWPEEPDFSWEQDWARRLALPRAILAARFVGHVEQRNDL